MITPRGAQDDPEAGITLVELLIYMLLSVIVLAVVGGVLVTGLRTQARVQTVTDATTTAQQIVSSIQSGVRNASAVTVISPPTAGSQMLIARVVGMDPASTAATCQAWYYTPTNGGAVYMKKTSSPISQPGSDPPSGWSLLGVGVTPSSNGGSVFTAPAGLRVELTFNVAAVAQPYVAMLTTVYTPQTTTVSAPCY
jgi:type II secretory pathway pseudopilin PulG